MYRKLIAVPLMGFVGLSVLVAGLLTAPSPPGGARGLTADSALFSGLIGGAGGVLLLAIAAAMGWVAAFHPGRQYPVWLLLGKYTAVLTGLLLTAAILWERSMWAGVRAAVLYGQTQAPLVKVLAASYLLRSLPEAIALSFFLAAPFYWLIRGVQVRSLRRATFEAWVEARRLLLPGIMLLVAGVALEAWAGPTLTTWILR